MKSQVDSYRCDSCDSACYICPMVRWMYAFDSWQTNNCVVIVVTFSVSPCFCFSISILLTLLFIWTNLNFLFYHRNDILQVVIAIKIKVASCSWGRPVYHQLRRWKLWRWSGSWASTAPTFTKKVQANASVGNWLCLDDVGNEA